MAHSTNTALDALLEQTASHRASCLYLNPDAPAEMETESGMLTGEDIPRDMLDNLLWEVTPRDAWRELQDTGRTEFDLESPYGAFNAIVWQTDAGLRATLRPLEPGRTWPSGSPMPSSHRGPLSRVIVPLCILAAVAAMLWVLIAPLFGPHHQALQASTLNNVKQLALAVMQYAQDYDGTFPGWVRNPDGAYAHNAWDEQINAHVKSKDIYSNGKRGIKSPSDPKHARVLTYALNGALIAPYDGMTGDVDWRAAPVAAGPHPTLLGPSSVSEPAETILFAEVSTDAPPPTTPPGAAGPLPASGISPARPAQEWISAWPDGDSATGAVIDISPRTWVSHGPDTTDAWYNDNNPRYSDTVRNGVARDLYSGGGAYGFVDGHVKFMKIADSVGIGQTAKGRAITAANWFKPTNPYNMWNPRR